MSTKWFPCVLYYRILKVCCLFEILINKKACCLLLSNESMHQNNKMTKIFLEQGKRKDYTYSKYKYVKNFCFLPTRYNFITTDYMIIIYALNKFVAFINMLIFSKQKNYVLIIQMTFIYELIISFWMIYFEIKVVLWLKCNIHSWYIF